MNRSQLIMAIIFAGILFVLFSFFYFRESKKECVGYLSNQKIFQEFSGTKELEKKFSKLQEKQKNILDSINFEIKMLEGGKKNSENDISAKKATFNKLLAEFSQSNQEQYQQYNDAIWKQINQYVSEYGKVNNYKFIYGADGSGNLMYADSTYDITKEVLKFINEKYAGN